MHKDSIAEVVVGEQFNRMVEQERARCEIIPMPGLDQACPFLDADRIIEIALRAAVVMRISLIAQLN